MVYVNLVSKIHLYAHVLASSEVFLPSLMSSADKPL
jgi:hypothetical protein